MTETNSPAQAAAATIRDRVGFDPEIAIVLGSGLGPFAETLEDATTVPYSEIPGFRTNTVAGHAGNLVAGRCGGVNVVCLNGRSHVYEGVEASAITTPVRALKLLGVELLLLTNASGSLRPDVGPGSLVAISDHINMLGFNPLTGPNDDSIGPRFPSMRDVYDPPTRAQLHKTADALGMELQDGVYLGWPGPTFETPAEIRAFKSLGADLVGMSTVAEVITARHCGLRVAAVSAVTNLAEGLTDIELSHEQTLQGAKAGAEKLIILLRRWLEVYNNGRDEQSARQSVAT